MSSTYTTGVLQYEKTSVSNNEGEKTVFFEISGCGYVTEYEKVALPNYTVHLPSQKDMIVDIDVDEDLNERINGGNSDGDCEYA